MTFPRESGVLLHPTSLPGPHGIGDFGEQAFRFVDWLSRAGQRLWQIMPLGPTGYGDSPYSSPSAFAGNPLLISLAWLHEDGLLKDDDFADCPEFPVDHVYFGAVTRFKNRLLRHAFDRFQSEVNASLKSDCQRFCDAESWWLDDYALFMTLKHANEMRGWQDWDAAIRKRQPEAIERTASTHAEEIRFHKFVQFLFQRQWLELRAFANARGVRIVGDIPIFVAEDSADVWANQPRFKIDAEGRASVVAGVPPDPFSATGQIWGNPLYDWRAMRADDFLWWRRRLERTFQLVDIVRIDHFRAFAAAWVVPSGAVTAGLGHWELTPGGEVFASIRRALGDVPIIVEDLGVITPDVVALREILGFPGMNVLQFAFDDDPENVYLPHNYRRNSVVYTATHDNQTTIGWFASRPEHERQAIQGYLGCDGSDIAWDLIRIALSSTANTAIISMQDILRLGNEARMNTAGQALGILSWRYREEALSSGLASGLRDLTWMYGRLAGDSPRRGANPWDYTELHAEHPAQQPS